LVRKPNPLIHTQAGIQRPRARAAEPWVPASAWTSGLTDDFVRQNMRYIIAVGELAAVPESVAAFVASVAERGQRPHLKAC
jgi:hypothetical protein